MTKVVIKNDVSFVEALLFCPECTEQHIDRDEWATTPHRTHLCEFCGERFDVVVVGVER